MTNSAKRKMVEELRRQGCSLSDIVARTGVPQTTVHRWTIGLTPAPAPRPPASAEPPAGVADRAGWLRAQLAHAEQQGQNPGPGAAAWAAHALRVRDALDRTEAEARKDLEAAGRSAEPDPVAIAQSILDALPQLARQIPRERGMQLHRELGRILGVVDDE